MFPCLGNPDLSYMSGGSVRRENVTIGLAYSFGTVTNDYVLILFLFCQVIGENYHTSTSTAGNRNLKYTNVKFAIAHTNTIHNTFNPESLTATSITVIIVLYICSWKHLLILAW